MPTTCKFQLGNDDKLYYCGEKLDGTVELTLEETKNLNGVKLIIAGVATVEWVLFKNRVNRTFKGSETCFRTEIDLLKPEGSNEAMDVPVGTHTYNFDCFLPETLPATFEGHYGRIQYIITILMQRSYKPKPKVFTVEFIVLQKMDLNTGPPSIRGPARAEIARTFRCWPCRTGPLVVAMQTSATGYVPGQRIPIMLDVNNRSGYKIHSIQLKLVMVVSYTCDTPRVKIKVDRDDVVQAELTQSDDPDEATYEESLLVPQLPVSRGSDSRCTIIQIGYELEAELEVGAVHHILNLDIPIVIGTIPLNCDRRESTIMELES